MHLKAWTVGMRATTTHAAGTPAALWEKHEQTPLIVAGYWSEGGPDRFQQCGAKGATFQLCHSLSQSCTGLIWCTVYCTYLLQVYITILNIVYVFYCTLLSWSCILSASRRSPLSVSPGIDDRDKAFMQRLRNLAHEALTWPHLGERQRLVWAAALELEAVPLQDHLQGLEFIGISNGIEPCLFFSTRKLPDLVLQ